MKVEKRDNPKVSVDKIPVGECFEFEDEIYIRLDENDNSLDSGFSGGVPVLRLTGRTLVEWFDADGEEVLPVNCKLVIGEG